MQSRIFRRWLALFGVLAGLSLVTGTALAAAPLTEKTTATKTTTKKTPADETGLTGAAVLDFTIGVPGKTGCLVCHGDPKLKNVRTKRALYISESEIMASAHKDLACTKCHTDFSAVNAASSHQGLAGGSRKVAGLSCKNCHQHAAQLKIYDTSVHGRAALGGDLDAPTCGDCHGSHDIKSFKKNKTYKQEFKMRAAEVCGKCHKDFYDSYNDYYHGAAYKTGAPDSPTCWDCHGAHQILPAKDDQSRVAKSNLAKTCGGCHKDSRAGFTDFADLVHDRQTVMKENLVIKYKDKLVTWLKKTF